MKEARIWVLLTILVVAACTARPVGGPASPLVPAAAVSPLSPQMTPSDVPPERPREGIEEAAILLQQSGGFAGIAEEWAIYPDGRIVGRDGQEWRVEPAQVQQVLNEAEAMGFFQMKANYVPLDTCCDRILSILTMRNGERVHTVRLLEDAEAPASLWDLLEAVRRLISRPGAP